MSHRGNDLVLGTTADGRTIMLPAQRRLESLAILGQTGTGKSSFLSGLIRSDLRAYPRTKCPVIVVDPHGKLVRDTLAFLASTGRQHLPVTVVSFSEPDPMVIRYNPLRPRRTESSVVIDTLVQAIAFVWGEQNTDATPLLARWLHNILYTLYSQGKTLADAIHYFTAEGQVNIDRIDAPLVRNDWLRALKYKREFESNIASTINRLHRLLVSPVLRAMFGQTGPSLDFRQVLDDGGIVLINLARDGGVISRENADLLGKFLLADIWSCIEERGKRDGLRPCYLYVDEFWRFVSPTTSEMFSQARGYALGVHVATQFPEQLRTGAFGERIYNELMEDCRSKVVFRLRTRPNLEPVAESLFLSTFDVDAIKHQHYSTKVIGHRLAYMPSFGQGTTRSHGGGSQQSHTKGRNRSNTTNWNHTDTTTHTQGTNHVHSDTASIGATIGAGTTVSRGRTASTQWSDGETEGQARGTQWSESTGTNHGGNRDRSRSVNVTRNLGKPSDELKDEVTRRDRRPDYHSLVGDADGNGECDDALDDVTRTVTISESRAEGDGESSGTSSNSSHSGNRSESRGSSRSHGGSAGNNASFAESNNQQVSASLGSSDAFGESESFGEGTADSVGGAEMEGTSEADTTGTSSQWSDAATNSFNLSPMLFPVLRKEADAPIFLSIADQIVVAMQRIARLKNRQAYVLAGDMDVPELIRTPDVNPPDISRTCTDLCIEWYQQESGLALPLQEALRRMTDRDKLANVVVPVIEADADFERPHGRRLKAAIVK